MRKLHTFDPALALANAQAAAAELRAINARLEAEHAIWQTHELHPAGTRARIAALEAEVERLSADIRSEVQNVRIYQRAEKIAIRERDQARAAFCDLYQAISDEGYMALLEKYAPTFEAMQKRQVTVTAGRKKVKR